MAQRTLDEFQNKSNGGYNGPTFFNLKNDGDSAIVRIMHATPESITVYETHKATTPKFKYGRTVACLRDLRDSIDKCPLCNSGNKDLQKVYQKVFVHFIEYVRQDDGTIKPEPRIWERPIGFAWELKSKMKMYGPLDKVLFIITRHTPDPNNKQNTTYSIDYAPAEMYPQSAYPNMPELFDNFDVMNHGLYAPSYEDMEYYLVNADFPTKAPQSNDQSHDATPTVEMHNEQSTVHTADYEQSAPWDDTPFNNSPVNASNSVNIEGQSSGGAPQRPTRYY